MQGETHLMFGERSSGMTVRFCWFSSQTQENNFYHWFLCLWPKLLKRLSVPTVCTLLEQGNLNWHPRWNYYLPRSDWDECKPRSAFQQEKCRDCEGKVGCNSSRGLDCVLSSLTLIGDTAACSRGEREEMMASDVCGRGYSLQEGWILKQE